MKLGIHLCLDLQVPLVGERNALEYLLSREENQPMGKFKEFIRETLDSNLNLTNLLNKLLESYNYESGKKKIEVNTNNINSLIIDITNSFKGIATIRDIKINLNLDKNLPNIKFDKNEISKVLFTLVENALEHSPNNSNITISNYRDENSINICIHDNGHGIEADIKSRIFKRYEMAQSIERKIGSGLSLYIAKLILDAHNGNIWYQSNAETGTKFCFSLPIIINNHFP